MKKFILFGFLAFFAFACGSDGSKSADKSSSESKTEKKEEISDKGVGPITKVEINNPLNDDMVAEGKKTYEIKCAACHKLTDQRVVGPGWSGVTDKRTPEWIMNMTTNVEEMLAKDPAAKELLKECLVRMPNQNLTNEDAREVLEFMFQNDGKYLPN